MTEPEGQSPTETTAADPQPKDRRAATEALHQIPELVAELREQFLCYLSARGALARARLRSAFLSASLVAVFMAVRYVALITATVLLLVGAAHGLGEAFGGRVWLGELVMGVVVLALAGAGVFRKTQSARRRACDLTIRHFEQLKEQQRARFHEEGQTSHAADSERNPIP